MIKFEKPDYKITEYIEDAHYGKFEISPLERGYAQTLGTALRRVMLSSMPGTAITSVAIMELCMNFKKLKVLLKMLLK